MQRLAVNIYCRLLYPLVLHRIFHLQHAIVNIDGYRFCVPLGDRGGIGMATLGYPAKSYMASVFKQVVKPGMTVVDIGAYVGYYTIIASKIVGNSGKVFSFEPDPSNYSILLRNIEANRCHNVVSIQKAVSDRSGHLIFFLNPIDSTCHTLYPLEGRGVKKISVECCKLDDLLADERVEIIKMDIEGAELVALQGMTRTLAYNPDIILFIELQPTNLKRAGASPLDLITFLEEQNFEVFLIDEERGRLIGGIADMPPRHKESNLLCVRGAKAYGLVNHVITC